MGSSVTLPFVSALGEDWPLVLLVSTVTLLASLSVGWIVGVTAKLDRATALWSSIPGVASGVVALSGEFGARQGTVAFGQYIRVLLIALVAAVIATALAADRVVTGPGISINAANVTLFMGLAIGCALIAIRFRKPGINMLLPMAATAGLQLTGIIEMHPPGPLMWFAFGVVGLAVGTAFDTKQLKDASRAVPYFVVGSLVLIAVSVIPAFVLVGIAGVDPLTAFLATTPGGLDSVAILAATAGADLAFVMLFQTARFLMVLVFGIPLIRLLSTRLSNQSACETTNGDTL